MTLRTIDPVAAKRLVDDGAIIVDIREADEHAREKIEGAQHLPLSRLDERHLLVAESRPVIFHCKSGARTMGAAARLSGKIADKSCEAYVVEGGIDAWKKAGLPVQTDRAQPLELQRQVQLGAGSLALVGTILGLTVSPWFFVVPAGVGSGLILAGATGVCGMASLLIRAPWNRALQGVRQQA